MKHNTNLPNPKRSSSRSRSRGMTIIEISLTLALMMALTSVVVISSSGISEWKLARSAGLDLRTVYVAQKSYLADHPTATIDAVSAADLLPYMPITGAAIPTIEALDGSDLPVNFNVMPPVAGIGTAYDPSGDPSDGLWDVGAP